jgi:integrase
MPKLKLTDLAVKRLKAPRGVQVDYFDLSLPSFGLRVTGPTPRTPDGRKSWFAFYRLGSQQRRLTFQPPYPGLGLADARQQAREAFQAVGRGEDPASKQRALWAEKRRLAERGPDTVENVFAEFMKRHMAGKERAPGYIAGVRRNFDNHVLPYWRGRLIGSITRRDVIELLDRIIDAGKASAGQMRKQGGPYAANRTRGAIIKLFNWSIQRGIVETSPAAMVEKPGTERSRDRVLSDAELKLIWCATEALTYPWRPYFRLLIATGQRREETARIRWRDIDEAEAIWLIPAEATKADRAHAVPLSRLALASLSECPQGGGYVFTTRRQTRRPGMKGEPGEAPLGAFGKAKTVLDAEIARIAAETGAPLPQPWTIHDLRRTATTTLGRLGVARFIQQRILNHADRGVTAVYDRYSYLPEKRAALDRWAKHIETLVNPPPALRIVN